MRKEMHDLLQCLIDATPEEKKVFLSRLDFVIRVKERLAKLESLQTGNPQPAKLTKPKLTKEAQFQLSFLGTLVITTVGLIVVAWAVLTR